MSGQSTIIAITLLRNAIRESGLSDAVIAAKAGISPKTFATARNGWLVTPRMRRRIESALGRAIWTPDGEFARQQMLTAWLGFDPWLLKLWATQVRAREKGVRCGKNPRKALVIARLFAAYEAASPKPTRRHRPAKKISTAGIPSAEKTRSKKPK